mgnify:CR=1 FL=1
MADFSSIDRTTEDKDIAREGMAATGNPCLLYTSDAADE